MRRMRRGSAVFRGIFFLNKTIKVNKCVMNDVVKIHSHSCLESLSVVCVHSESGYIKIQPFKMDFALPFGVEIPIKCHRRTEI